MPGSDFTVTLLKFRTFFRKLEIMLAAEDRILSEDNFNELVENISKEPSLLRYDFIGLSRRYGLTEMENV